LEVILRARSAEEVAVGQNVEYEVTITNRGDGVARNIKLVAHFDAGLEHLMDTLHTHQIGKTDIRALAPNDSERIPLAFKVVASGRQCHQVTVSADGVEPQTREGCINGTQAAIGVKIDGVHQSVVGAVAEFSILVRNTSSNPANDVVLRVQLDPAIEPIVEGGFIRMEDGSVALKLGQLAASEKRSFRLRTSCRNPSTHACATASVTALGGVVSQDQKCLEILPAMPNSPPPPAPGA
jgi:uncharacterized repeat protein (TIGR01451 family)